MVFVGVCVLLLVFVGFYESMWVSVGYFVFVVFCGFVGFVDFCGFRDE